MPDPRQKLYSALSDKFDLGTLEEFNSKMDNPESRKKLYKAVSDGNFDLGSYDDFESKIGSKKKSADSTSTSSNPKLDSETKTGSSAGQASTKNSSGFPKVDSNSVAPNYDEMKPAVENPIGKAKRLQKELSNVKVTPENMDQISSKTDELTSLKKQNAQAVETSRRNKVKELETSFYDATKNNDDEAVAEQRLQDAINTKGVWNNVKDIAKKSYNAAVSGLSSLADVHPDDIKTLKTSTDPLSSEKQQIITEAKKNKEKLTDLEINQRAQELFKSKEKDNLFIDRANSFLDNLPEEDKSVLKQDRALKADHLGEDNLKRLKVVSAIRTVAENKISEYKNIESKLTKLKENNQEFPEDLYQKYQSLGTEIKNIGSELQKNENYILKNKKDLGTAQQEFDLFKREYGDIKNFIGNIGASASELGTGILGAVNYAASFSPNPIDRINSMKGQELVSNLNEGIQENRNNLRKPVESIESAEGFVNYASDLVANQIPILVATSTGMEGLAAIGLSSTGKKFTDMNNEVLKGKAKYSPLEMAVAPLLYGGAEVVSELPTMSILTKGGRVLESVAKNEVSLLTKTAKEKAIEWAKDYGVDMSKEMAGEQFTNFAQNFNDKYVLGKKDVNLLDNTGQVFKDTFTLTSMLKVAPHAFGAVVQPFQSKTDLGKLDENSRKIIEFSKQLNSENLTDTEKQVIQKQIETATAESSKIVANTIGKIDNMPSELYDEVVNLNTKAGEIKSQAREISDGNLSNKKQLLEGLQEEYKTLQEQRNSIIDGRTSAVDVLPLKEQEKLKKQALEDLVTELNPDGKKNMEITNEQILERANEIYTDSKKNEEVKTEVNLPLSKPESQENGLKVEGNSPQKEETKDQKAPIKLTEEEKAKVQEKVVSKPRVILRSGKVGTDAFFALPNEGVFGEVVDKVGNDKNVTAYRYPKDFKIKDLSNEVVFDDYMSNKMFEDTKEEGYDAAYVMEIDGSKVLHVINTEKLTLLDEKLPELRNNEAVQKPNTSTDENVRPGTEPNVAQGKNEEVQSSIKPKTNKGEVGPKLQEINKTKFGLNDKESKANAIVMEKTIETMAKRAGISKEEMFDKIDFEKGDSKTIEKLSKKGKALFQIVGESAELKDNYRKNLEIAKSLESKGKTEKEIWVATGWQKGTDGKWRAEVDDSKMVMDKSFMGMRGYTLGEAIQYDDLFDLYPDLKDVKVSVIPNLGNMLGAYLPTKNLIMLNGARSKAQARSTLLHEIQHIVQGKEGFATGGTAKMAEDYLKKKMSSIQIAKNIPKGLAKAASKLSSSLFNGVNIESSKEEFNAELEKAKRFLSKDVFDLYQSIAGEVESRNVQSRMNMTSEERKNTPLSETEDVARDEQIVLFQGEQGAMLAEDGKFIIYALEDPNVSTPLHEMAHVYEHYLSETERDTVLEDAGHDSWTRETSEHFARGFEKYLADGIAPNPEMKKLFEDFKKWLTDIYKGITNSEIDINLSPAMQKVYDEMLGAKKTESNTNRESDNAKEQDEFDNLLSGEAEKRRKEGKYSRDGVEFIRQENSNGPTGKKDTVKFADKVEVPFEYSLMEAEDVQPSHINGRRNANFFITEAQPKNRKDDASKKASDEIGRNPKLKEAGENSNAYSGAPVVNERGEVIQGNNRAEGLKKHYGNNGKNYKEQLKAEAAKFGFTPEQIEGMKNPILVRKVAVNDAKAIELGNHDVKDLETGGTRRIDPVTISRRIPKITKSKITDILFGDNSDKTLNQAVRDKLNPLINSLLPYLNEAQVESIIRKDGTPRPNGIQDLEKLVQHFLFDGGNVNMPEHFESLSGVARDGLLKSLPKLLSIETAKSIISEIQNAIGAFHAFKNSGVENFNEWLTQSDMFNEGKTPSENYNPLEIEIADILINAKNQKEIKTIFDGYAKEATDFEGDMFEPSKKGSGKKEAVKEIFKVENYENKGNDGSGKQETPVVEGGKKGSGGGNNRNQNGNSEGENNGGGIGEVSNEQNRKNSLAKERVQYEKVSPKNAPKKLSKIIKDVAVGLKSHLIYSRSKSRNTLGSYNPRNTLVRITKSGDIDTVAHELGHLLDDRLNILGTIPEVDKAKINYQLKWYSDRGGSNPPAKYNAAQKVEYLEREGLAEFIRSYVANPSQTKILAPELLVHFEKTIDAKTQTVLTKFSEDYLDFANASGIEKTLSNIEEIDLPNKNKFIEWIKGFRNSGDKLSFTKMDKFYGEMANSNHFGIKAFKSLLDIQGKTDLKSHENFEIMSRLFYGINGKLENVFSKGMINSKNERLKVEGGIFEKDNKGRTVYKDGTAMNVKWLIDGLDITTEESLKKDMGDVIAMAVAERTIEYAKKFERSDNLTGIGGSIETDLTTAVNTLNEFKALKKTDKSKFDRIKEGVKRYRQMADATLQYAADKGRISQEQLQQIKAGNEYYVALNRNTELEPGEDLFSSFNTGTNGIGAAKDIIKKAKGGTATIENPYLSLLKNMNNIIKEADRNEVMLSFVEPLINKRKMGEGDPIDLSKIGFIANEGDAETIKVFRDGKLEKWKFDRDIYSSLKNIESIASNPIFTFLSKPSQLIRWTVTHNPVFYARNIVKDTQARMIVSNDHSSFNDMIHNSGDKDLFELFGGSQAGHLHTSKESYAKTMKGTIKEITKKGGIVINPIKWGEKYVKLLQTGENLNRIAEFNNSYKVAKEKGMSDYDAGLYAAFQARDLMDFAVAGHTMREINKIVVFSNAGVQSLRKAGKSFKNDPAGFATRTALFSVIPTLAFAILRNAMGDDDEYEDLPDNQRDMFFNFKTPATGDAWVSIPKPYELGLFSAYVDRGISKIRGNDKAFDGITATAMKTLMPFDESSFLGGLKPIIETKMNRDTYTDRSIVPEWEVGKLLELRKGTSKASLIGQKTSKLFKEAGMSVDPRNIDHILKGYGTYFANQGMAVSDLAKKDRAQVNFWITKSGFAKDIPTYNSKSVKKATDLAVELGKINSKMMKEMRNDIEAFYSETDIKKRKVLLKNIYKKSKQITNYLEKEKKEVLNKIQKEEK